jgi:hypothetical protein
VRRPRLAAPEAPCPTPLTRAVLERASIRPRKRYGAVSIKPKCHPESGMTVGYCWTDGCAVLICATCDAGVARLQVAFEVPS